MKKITYTALVALTAAFTSGTARAEELWNPHLRGVNEGLAAAALPPQGVYFVDNAYFLSFKSYNGSGQSTGARLDGFVDVPILLWNPGIKVLGADFAAAIAQPFDYTNVTTPGGGGGNGHWGSFNTILVPGELSWALPHDVHVKADLAVYLNDASSSPAHPPVNGGAGAGNSQTTLEPGFALSWLNDGWNLSADLHYDYSFKDSNTGIRSGDQIAVDYTATKTFDKWTAGVGAYQENQIERDTTNGASTAGTTRLTYGIGPIAGYNFGPLNVSATYNHAITTHNDFGGDIYNFRAVVPF